MTRRFVGPMIAALACTIFVAACGKSTPPPTKECIEAARLYAEALDQDRLAPEGEKAAGVAIRKTAIAEFEARKVQACGE